MKTKTSKRQLGVGIVGMNGHQIHRAVMANKRTKLVAAAEVDKLQFAQDVNNASGIKTYDSLDDLLSDDKVELVSICAAKRSEQAAITVSCLQHGKHVYAEKPCAFSEEELDKIILTAAENKVKFHEMAGTAFEEPYRTMSEIVRSGSLGEIVQVFAQKSYPYYPARPDDEDIDGGLIRQSAIHAVRMIEHVCRIKVADVLARETTFGNFRANPHGLRIAAELSLQLENGGLASIVANYLNPITFGKWGNEHLRIFGTRGMLESVSGKSSCRLTLEGSRPEYIRKQSRKMTFFDYVVAEILDQQDMPLSLEDELHPLRIVIRAKGNLVGN